ncbi:MAG: ORF6N domain-containing protein [Lentisphaerae bacterium]|nr:ORF6N domain-containing protein [Lentisphaerota bacterium]
MNKNNELLVPIERIHNRILLMRGQKVLLDRDLASLYGVETRRLVEQVKRNSKRFPEDFMFQMSMDEFEKWRSQIAMSKSDIMGLRRPPYAFSEQGVAMLSSVLNSERAILVNIAIMRAFVQMRTILETNAKFAAKMKELAHIFHEKNKKILANHL